MGTNEEQELIGDKTNQIEKLIESVSGQIGEAYERANEYENVVESLHNFTDETNTIICDLDDGEENSIDVVKLSEHLQTMDELKEKIDNEGESMKNSILKLSERCKFGATEEDKLVIDSRSDTVLETFYECQQQVQSVLEKVKIDHQKAADLEIWIERPRQEIAKDISLVEPDEIRHWLNKIQEINDDQCLQLVEEGKQRITDHENFKIE